MQRPEFTPDGGYSLIVRPEPVMFTPRLNPPRQGYFTYFLKEKIMNAVKLFFATLFAFLMSFAANAALSTEVTTAMGDGLTDVKALGALGLIIVIAVAVFAKMKRAA